MKLKMSIWRQLKISDLIENESLEIGDGYRAKNSEMASAGLPFARAGNVNNGFDFEDADFLSQKSVTQVGNKISQPDDAVITTKGTFGRVAYVRPSTPRFVYSPQLCYWRVKNSSVIQPRFVYYWLQGPDFLSQAFQVKSSTDMADYTSLTDQRRMVITAPDVESQKKIAAILSAYDELIENNQRRITLLEKMAEEIYREWFVRMHFPGHEKVNKVKGLPEGWKIQKLGQLFNTSSGGTPPRENTSNFNGEICWAKTGELKSTFVLDTEERISQSGIDSSAAKIYPRYTIVIAMYCAMPDISILAVDSATNQACCAFFPKNDYFHYSYSYLLIKFAQKHMINFAHGAAQQNLSQELIKGFPLLTPTKDLITEYSKVAEPIFIQVEQLMKTNTYLRKIRDQLLPRLISGKLSVEHLDIQFPPGMEESACV